LRDALRFGKEQANVPMDAKNRRQSAVLVLVALDAFAKKKFMVYNGYTSKNVKK
jgi:hypothetical protein